MMGGHWELRNTTPGRPFRLALPPDLTESQIAWIREHLPKVWRLEQSDLPIGSASTRPHVIDYETQRQLMIDIGALQVQLLELTDKKTQLELRIARLQKVEKMRSKRVKSFASALNDILSNIDLPDMEEKGNG